MTTPSDASLTPSRLSRRRWLTIAAAAAGAVAVSGASATAASAASLAGQTAAAPAVVQSPAAQMKASQVMNWFAQSSQGGFFNGVRNGHYASAGVDMTIEQGGPQISAVPLVAAGRHTFGMVTADAVLSAREEGIPIVMVFPAFQRNPQGLMFHASNPVSDFSELNGRKVYVSGAGIFWRVISAKYNLTDVQQFAYNGQLATFLSDETNVSQCFVTSEPQILKGQGKEVGFLVNADSGFNPYQNAMVCMESTIRDQPDLVQAYVSASLKAWIEYINDPQPTLQYIKAEYNKDKDLEIEAKVFEAEKAGFFTGAEGWDPSKMARMTDERWSELYTMMRQYGILTKDQDYTKAFDASFVEKAHASMM
ncbi:MAG: ABC transporter substrate-binding protein [Chloroflexi bacterium]|nr:ABC transporter substrate-binding protein [Chloroflexota bacterium]